MLVKIRSASKICHFFSIKKEKAIQKPSHQFAPLFNAYVQAINKQNGRHGSLLETPFKRKHLKNESSLKKLILYIHNNPIQHNFVEKIQQYPWSSYASIISDQKTAIERKKVLSQFENKENFIYCHQQKMDVISLEK